MLYITQALLVFSVACLIDGAQDLSYREDGLNWGGLCVTSQRQSPINLVSNQFTSGKAPSSTKLSFGTGSNVTVHNLGNQIRVLWKQAEPSTATVTLGSFYGQPNATGSINIPGTNTTAGLAETVLSITPTQFHFHTTSEHTLEGRYAPLELHLVTNATAANTSCANNCTAVYSVLYDFSPGGLEGNAFLAPFLDSIPANAMADNVTTLGSNFTLNLTQLLPDNASQYVQYPGSLTTPPCTENILWTIFTNDEPIAFSQVQTLSDALATAQMEGFVPERTDNRLPQLLNNRTVWYFDS